MTHLAALAASALLTAIWQGTLLAVVVALCLRLLPGLSAAVRSAIWMAVFAILLVLHFTPASHTAAHPIHATPLWSLALATLWLSLTLFRATQLALSTHRLRAVSKRCTPLRPNFRAPFIEPLSHSMSGSTPKSNSTPNTRHYTLCTSPDVDRPSVLGFFHPRILLPPGLAEKLTPSELHQVLLHETEHLRRSDDWTNLLQKIALVLFPLNPVLLWVERRLCLERELACDDRVLRATGARKAYAACLTRLAEHAILRRSLTLALGVLGNRPRQSELSARVHRILRRPQQLLSPAKAHLATATLLLVVLTISATLARTPRLITFTSNPPITASTELASDSWTATPTLAKATEDARPHPILTSARVGETTNRAKMTVAIPAHPRRIRRVATTPDAPGPIDLGWHVEQVQHYTVQTSVRVVPVTYAVATPEGWIIFQL